MKRLINWVKNPLSLLFSIVFSVLVWLVFYPAILSLDSVYMYLEAASKFGFTDEKALLLPFALSLILKAGGNLSILILFQCLAGFLAIRFLALSLAACFKFEEKTGDLIVFLVLFVLSSPLFLTSIYLVTFWMDTWLAIILLLASALLIELYFSIDINTNSYTFRIIVLCVVVSMALLVRLNSFVLYPVMALALERVLHQGIIKVRYKVVIILCPIFIFGLFMFLQYDILKVTRSHQDHTVFAVDVASVLEYDPSICEKALLSACDVLTDYYPCNFQVGMGALDCTYDQSKGMVYRPFYFLRNNSAMESDYRYIIQEHTLTWLAVKLLNFSDYLRPVTNRYFFQVQDPVLLKEANLVTSPRFSFLRERIFSELIWVSQEPILRWFSFVHLPWLVIDVCGIVACILIALRSRQRDKYLFFAIILTIPASYYISYLIAITASDFRFMYPSTLVMQVITLTCMFSVAAEKIRLRKQGLIGKHRSEAPGHSYESVSE